MNEDQPTRAECDAEQYSDERYVVVIEVPHVHENVGGHIEDRIISRLMEIEELQDAYAEVHHDTTPDHESCIQSLRHADRGLAAANNDLDKLRAELAEVKRERDKLTVYLEKLGRAASRA